MAHGYHVFLETVTLGDSVIIGHGLLGGHVMMMAPQVIGAVEADVLKELMGGHCQMISMTENSRSLNHHLWYPTSVTV